MGKRMESLRTFPFTFASTAGNAHTGMHTRSQIFDNIWTRSKNANIDRFDYNRITISFSSFFNPQYLEFDTSVKCYSHFSCSLHRHHPLPLYLLCSVRSKVFPLAHFVVEHGLFKCLSQSILVTKTNGYVAPPRAPPHSIPYTWFTRNTKVFHDFTLFHFFFVFFLLELHKVQDK